VKSRLVAGLLTTIVGVTLLTWPVPSIVVVSTLFGIYLLMSSFAELYLAFTLPRSPVTRGVLFISGGLSLVLAMLSLRHYGDGYAVLLLSLCIGIGFILQGVAAVAAGITGDELPGRGWYVVTGALSVIAGLVMLMWPFASIAVFILAAGIWLVVIGISQIMHAFQTRKAASSTPHRPVDGSADHLAEPEDSATQRLRSSSKE
jgi:uncharacterized membrane protein HdeD (DUF308 family)